MLRWQFVTVMSHSKRCFIPPNIPKNTLIEFLLRHANPQQHAKAAKNPTLSLSQFAPQSSSIRIRIICLAKNSMTPPLLILAKLACKHHFYYSFLDDEKNTCPSCTLKALMNTPVGVVSMTAIENFMIHNKLIIFFILHI